MDIKKCLTNSDGASAWQAHWSMLSNTLVESVTDAAAVEVVIDAATVDVVCLMLMQ